MKRVKAALFVFGPEEKEYLRAPVRRNGSYSSSVTSQTARILGQNRTPNAVAVAVVAPLKNKAAVLLLGRGFRRELPDWSAQIGPE